VRQRTEACPFFAGGAGYLIKRGGILSALLIDLSAEYNGLSALFRSLSAEKGSLSAKTSNLSTKRQKMTKNKGQPRSRLPGFFQNQELRPVTLTH
jgi:hypothetical protein